MFKQFFKGLGGLLSAIWSFLFESFTHYDSVLADVQDMVTTFNEIKANLQKEVEDIKAFKFDPHWKTRVINVPSAVQAIQDLKSLFIDDFRDRIDTLFAPIHAMALIFQSDKITAGDPSQAVNALVKAQAKLGDISTMVHELAAALHEVGNLQDLFDQLLTQVESLDALFLNQSKPRKFLTERAYKRI